MEANSAKDHFLAVLSHELRNPLTPALISASDLEAAEHPDPAQLRLGLGIIRRNIELEARLVDDLLDVSRIGQGKLVIHPATVDLHDSIQHAAEMCYSTAQKNGNELTLSLEAAQHCIRGDAARLAQVFWNLILNAIKFTPCGGKISVRTSNPRPRRIIIEVADTGIGIQAEMLPRIFDPFQQGDPSRTRRYGGLGLGLSVARGFILAHKGSIAASSDGENKGSKFTIEFETVPTPSTPQRNGVKSSPAEIKPLAVLLVEDHEDTRTALERLLVRWGHEVRSASSVAGAVDTARGYEFDLLLSDIGLPDATGNELLGQLGKPEKLKAIAMSGYGMESDMKLSREAGFDLHLVKPITASNLREALTQLFTPEPGDHGSPGRFSNAASNGSELADSEFPGS